MRLTPVVDWVPQTLGLLAVVVIAVLASPVRGSGTFTLVHILLATAFYIPLTYGICAGVMLFWYTMLLERGGLRPSILQTSAIATTCPPLLILLRDHSLLAPLASALFVSGIMMLFPSPPSRTASAKSAVSFCASLLIQAGVAASVVQWSFVAAVTIGLAAIPITWRIRYERNETPNALLFLVAATVFTLAALLAHLQLKTGSASNPVGASGKSVSGSAYSGTVIGSQYRGVILSPEVEKYVVLVPPLPMMGHDPLRIHPDDPLSIPFYGVYWFFQAPDTEPPQDSYRVKGTPAELTFRSVDHNALKMEAHQKLGQLINLSCCSGIGLTIRDEDRRSGAVLIELLLVNSSLPAKPVQSLGLLAVEPRTRLLNFKIPSAPAISRFNEFAVRFLWTNPIQDRSAQISIDRFSLIPNRK